MLESNNRTASEIPDVSEKKKKLSLKNKLLIGSAGVVLAAIAGTGIGVATTTSGEKPPEATASSAPANPSETANEKGNNITPEYDFTPDLINIPAGLSDKEYATRLLDDINKWNMAGAKTSTYDTWRNSGLSKTVQSDVASENVQVVQNSHLFSAEALNSQFIQTIFQNYELTNEGFLQCWLVTYNKPGEKPAPGQFEAYNSTNSLDSVTTVGASGSGGRELIIDGTQHNNSDKNSTSKHENIVELNGLKFELHITTTVADGFEQINTYTAK